MRIAAMFAACALAACGPSTQSSNDAPSTDDLALPYGAIIGVGENWTLNADPGVRAVSFTVDGGGEPMEIAEVWAPPVTTEHDTYQLISGQITLDLADAPCSVDSIAYPMRATVTVAGQAHEGCAVMRWDYQLIALMPQIDACIAQSPETRWVSYAGEIEPETAVIRLQGNDKFVDCRVTNRAATVTPRDENLRLGGDGAALFVRGPGANPGGECYEAPEVRNASGEVLGWMMDPMGC